MSGDIEELLRLRRRVISFCNVHAASVWHFFRDNRFHLEYSPPSAPKSDSEHLTTTASCIESLETGDRAAVDSALERTRPPGDNQPPKYQSLVEAGRSFAAAAIGLPPEKWTSGKSARIYARCRALPAVIRYGIGRDSPPDLLAAELKSRRDNLRKHVEEVCKQLQNDDQRGIGEQKTTANEYFPANAFHSYWALRTLEAWTEALERLPSLEPGQNGVCSDGADCARSVDATPSTASPPPDNFTKFRKRIVDWAKSQLAYQAALHSSGSLAQDTDQLAWTTAILLRFLPPEDLLATAQRDLLKFALSTIFSKQGDKGTWRRGAPLFFYSEGGNAYCYVFETFAELLGSTLHQPRLRLGDWLRPHLIHLGRLLEFAYETAIPVKLRGSDEFMPTATDGFGWASGHRIGSTGAPEGWATASVFEYAQNLRVLVGGWAREASLAALNRSARRSNEPSEKHRKQLISRGNSHRERDSELSVGADLATSFVHPILSQTHTVERLDPDQPLIRKNSAVSAILYGPPGTSKTTLVELVAESLGWDFVEIPASAFVAEGLSEVQRTADRIFRHLLEVNRAVVLFDEIDELVRDREGAADAFGRFMTTSMLPKLAELWKQRKLIFFVATNHIEYFDAAITRAQRFDMLLFVPPTAFDPKWDELVKCVTALDSKVAELLTDEVKKAFEKRVRDAVRSAGELREASSTGGHRLISPLSYGVFLLLRWDQLSEVAERLIREATLSREGKTPLTTTDERLEAIRSALDHVQDHRLHMTQSLVGYVQALEFARQDYRVQRVWSLVVGDGIAVSDGQRCVFGIIHRTGAASEPRYWLTTNLSRPAKDKDEVEVGGKHCSLVFDCQEGVATLSLLK